MVIPYWRFGTTYKYHLQGWILWPLKMGPIGCPETLVKSYHYSRNSLEERSSHLLRGGSLASRKEHIISHGMYSLDFTGAFFYSAPILRSITRFIPLNLLNLHITQTEQIIKAFITRPPPYVYCLWTNKYSLLALFCMSQVCFFSPLKAISLLLTFNHA